MTSLLAPPEAIVLSLRPTEQSDSRTVLRRPPVLTGWGHGRGSARRTGGDRTSPGSSCTTATTASGSCPTRRSTSHGSSRPPTASASWLGRRGRPRRGARSSVRVVRGPAEAEPGDARLRQDALSCTAPGWSSRTATPPGAHGARARRAREGARADLPRRRGEPSRRDRRCSASSSPTAACAAALDVARPMSPRPKSQGVREWWRHRRGLRSTTRVESWRFATSVTAA